MHVFSWACAVTTGADFHTGQWQRLPQEKIPQRAPPCEEFDQPYDIKLVFVPKITFVLSKNQQKTAATKAALFDSNMHQNRLSAGASPQTPLVELTALPRLYFGGLLLKGGEGRGKGKGEEEGERR